MGGFQSEDTCNSSTLIVDWWSKCIWSLLIEWFGVKKAINFLPF